MTETPDSGQKAQDIGFAICGLIMRAAFSVSGILWNIIREIADGVFRVAIGVTAALLFRHSPLTGGQDSLLKPGHTYAISNAATHTGGSHPSHRI